MPSRPCGTASEDLAAWVPFVAGHCEEGQLMDRHPERYHTALVRGTRTTQKQQVTLQIEHHTHGYGNHNPGYGVFGVVSCMVNSR
jgi:hypothetical protein